MDESGCERDARMEPAAASCPVCGEPLRDRAAVQCRKCHTPHHMECWRFNRGCATYGCGCRGSMPSRLALPGAPGEAGRTLEVSSPVSLSEASVPGPMVALTILPALVALFAAAADAQTLFLAGAAALGLMLCFVLSRYGACREIFRFDAARESIQRRLEWLGLTLARQDDWMSAEEIVELHLHRIGSPRHYEIRALTTDGRRALLFRQRSSRLSQMKTMQPAEVEDEHIVDLAERMADAVDCTVRQLEGPAPPSTEEMRTAIREKLALVAAPPALPPGYAADGTNANTREADPPRERRRRDDAAAERGHP